jgi:hypothetical protein
MTLGYDTPCHFRVDVVCHDTLCTHVIGSPLCFRNVLTLKNRNKFDVIFRLIRPESNIVAESQLKP